MFSTEDRIRFKTDLYVETPSLDSDWLEDELDEIMGTRHERHLLGKPDVPIFKY